MTDPLQRATDARKPLNWLAGRGNRKEYWLYVATLFAVIVVLDLVGWDIGGGAFTGGLVVVWIRRFHDLGRTGWWAPALLVAELALALIAYLAVGEITGLVVGIVVTFIPLIALGVIPGQPQENRFGPPPPAGWRYMFTGR